MEKDRSHLASKKLPNCITNGGKANKHKDDKELLDIEYATSIVAWESQHSLEIEAKKIELSDLEDKLAQKEVELATFQGELYVFEVNYLRMVGRYFAELDDTRAKIAEALAQIHLADKKLQEEAMRARAQAQESAAASEAARSDPNSVSASFKPSVEIKILFRDIAKRIHPDLARDEEDGLRRHQFMAEANKAYRAGDVSRLQAILSEWEDSLKLVSQDLTTRLRHIIKKIFQVKERLRTLHATMKQLQNSGLSKLKQRAEAEEKKGRDLFAKMAEQLQNEIIRERARLSEILQRNAYR